MLPRLPWSNRLRKSLLLSLLRNTLRPSIRGLCRLLSLPYWSTMRAVCRAP